MISTSYWQNTLRGWTVLAVMPVVVRTGHIRPASRERSLLNKNTRDGTLAVDALNLGGPVELMPNAARIVELAIDKQAQTILMPVAARRQLNDLPDELWTKIGE